MDLHFFLFFPDLFFGFYLGLHVTDLLIIGLSLHASDMCLFGHGLCLNVFNPLFFGFGLHD